jgi:hypothetical protein
VHGPHFLWHTTDRSAAWTTITVPFHAFVPRRSLPENPPAERLDLPRVLGFGVIVVAGRGEIALDDISLLRPEP